MYISVELKFAFKNMKARKHKRPFIKTMAINTAKQGVYARYSDSDLFTNSKTILGATAKSPMAGQLKPQLGDAQAAFTKYEDSLVDAKSGNREAIATKNENKQELVDAMERLVIAVNYVAMGSLPLLNSTLMPLTTPKGKKVPKVITTPGDITATNMAGASGSVKLEAGDTGGANNFQFQHSPLPPTADTVWDSRGSTEKSYVFTGLKPLTTGYFRVVGVGPRKQFMISSVISCNII